MENLYLAFESLSKPLQDLCLKLTALHDAHPHNHPEQTAIHPVVRKHPDTGRAALYVNEHFTRRLVEMTAQESDILLGYLTKWVASPKFTVRYSWEPGTVCIWDNRCTQHFVINDFEGERVIERITVMGDEVAAAGGLMPMSLMSARGHYRQRVGTMTTSFPLAVFEVPRLFSQTSRRYGIKFTREHNPRFRYGPTLTGSDQRFCAAFYGSRVTTGLIVLPTLPHFHSQSTHLSWGLTQT